MTNKIKSVFAFLILSVLIVSTGCKKEKLDFDSGTYFGVKEILKSENCDADCGTVADCEGEMIKVKGKLDERNINNSDHQFYLIDENNSDFQIEVKVDESVSTDVFQKLTGMGSEVFKVEGEMEGYDAPTNATCKRQFLLRVDSADYVTME